MVKATWNGKVLAESKDTIVIEGNHYFPPNSVKQEYMQDSQLTTACPWKGLAHYKSLSVDGKELKDAAWYYPQPKDAAKQITGYFAFYRQKGIQVE